MDMEDARAVMEALDLVGVPTSDELVKKGVAPSAAIRDAGEGRILPRDADTGVARDEDDEPRLAFGEPELGGCLDARCLG